MTSLKTLVIISVLLLGFSISSCEVKSAPVAEANNANVDDEIIPQGPPAGVDLDQEEQDNEQENNQDDEQVDENDQNEQDEIEGENDPEREPVLDGLYDNNNEERQPEEQ